MSGKVIQVDVSDLQDFFKKMGSAGKDFKKELELFLEALGNEFLRVVSDEIIRRKVVDTSNLLGSFTKGASGNIWNITDGGLSLEVGTNVEYASYVNDGHWTNPKGVDRRWVPGYWDGSHFVYSPGSKTGMLLKQQWISGRPYWESAIRIMEKMVPELLEAKLNQWLENYFGG